MKANGFLIVSLVIAVFGIGFYYLGPIFGRWHEQLEAYLSRMKKSGTPQEPGDND